MVTELASEAETVPSELASEAGQENTAATGTAAARLMDSSFTIGGHACVESAPPVRDTAIEACV